MKFLLPFALLAGLGLVAGCNGPDTAKALSQTERPEPVQSAPAREVEVPVTIPILGAITSESHSNIGAETDGRVVALLVREGQHVMAGQSLIQLAADDAQTRFDAAKGGLKQAILAAQADEQISQARLQQAKLDLSHTQNNLTSAVTLAESRLAESQAHYDQLKRGPRQQEIEAANSDVVAAQLVVESDQTTADFAKLVLKRKSALLAQGGIAQNDVDQAQLDYSHAVQSVQFAQQQLRAKQLLLNLMKEGTPKEEMAQAAAQLSGAKESLRSAKANLSAIDDAKQAVAMAQADHDKAAARLIQLRAGNLSDEGAQVRLAEQDLLRTQIKTPIEGVVSSIKVVKGQVAKSGQVVAVVVGRGGMQLDATAMDQDMSRIRQGQRVILTLRGNSTRRFEGVVQDVLPPGGEGRSSRIIVSISDTSGLIAGSVANGDVQTSDTTKVIKIPVAAIFSQIDNEADVFVIENGNARQRPIQIRSQDSQSVTVASGLIAGDQIILNPPKGLRDGMAVTPQQQ